MAKVTFIKLSVDMLENNKVVLLLQQPYGRVGLLAWYSMITIAGKCNSDGDLMFTSDIAYDEEMLAMKLLIVEDSEKTLLKQALNFMEKYKMITRKNEVISLIGWSEYQSAADLAIYRARDNERKQEQQSKMNKKRNKAELSGKMAELSQENKDVRCKKREVREENKITHSVRREEDVMSDRVSEEERLEKLNSPHLINITYDGDKLLEHERLKELLQEYPKGLFIGREQTIINLPNDQWEDFKRLLAKDGTSYLSVKKILLTITTGEQVI